jgi:hypothetical protein
LSTATNLNAITILAARMMTIVAIRLRVASFLDISYSRREESGDIYKNSFGEFINHDITFDIIGSNLVDIAKIDIGCDVVAIHVFWCCYLFSNSSNLADIVSYNLI